MLVIKNAADAIYRAFALRQKRFPRGCWMRIWTLGWWMVRGGRWMGGFGGWRVSYASLMNLSSTDPGETWKIHSIRMGVQCANTYGQSCISI